MCLSYCVCSISVSVVIYFTVRAAAAALRFFVVKLKCKLGIHVCTMLSITHICITLNLEFCSEVESVAFEVLLRCCSHEHTPVSAD